MKQATLQYTAHASKSGYRLLEKARHSMGLRHNIIIKRQVQDPETHYILYDRKATGRHITELLRNDPRFQGYAHKLAAGDSFRRANGHTLQARHPTEARQQ